MTNPSQPPDLSRVAAFTLSDVKRGLRWRVLRWLGQVRLEHVVLAWPYGVMSACLADYGFPSARQWFFLVVALASARGFVAAFDRLTSPNAPSSSRRSRRHHSHTRGHDGLGMLLLALSTGVLFLVSCGSLNRLALALSPFALAGLLVGWHLRGRGWLGHFAWGASLGIVPLVAWVGLRGTLGYAADWPAVLLAASVALWAAGLDIVSSWRAARAQAGPTGRAQAGALFVARACHVLATVGLVLLVRYGPMGRVYVCGCVAFGVLLIYQHSLAKLRDRRQAALQLFSINCFATLVLVATAVLDIFIG